MPNMDPKKHAMPSQDPKIRAHNFDELMKRNVMYRPAEQAAREKNCRLIRKAEVDQNA